MVETNLAEILERIGARPVDPHEDDDKLDVSRLAVIREADSLMEAIVAERTNEQQRLLVTVTNDDFAPEFATGDVLTVDPSVPWTDGRYVVGVTGENLLLRVLTGGEGSWCLENSDGERLAVQAMVTVLGTVTRLRRTL